MKILVISLMTDLIVPADKAAGNGYRRNRLFCLREGS